ncbi:hypothetical protein ACJRO7_003592 [Eucalyptus globulus]|uniref:Non-structural maintenance of chromosomes element 1 homolog n=1 Tax=Eucalyptus globulus TaxID=34317 RepID=A0ABD3IWA1_EUCGL
MPELTDRHKVLIQALISRGPLSEKDFHAVFNGVAGKHPADHQQLFNDYLLKINKELSHVQCELRGCRDQNDGRVFYGFVNNVADDQSELGTKYSVPQIAFYKCIVEAIVQDATAQGCISDIDALNIRLENQMLNGAVPQSQDNSLSVPPAFRNFSISQKEKTLEQLVRDKWLFSDSDGKIGLGIRSFLDLRSWFRSNDIPSCEVCNEAAIKAELCPNDDCNIRIHQYCLKKRFSQKKAERVCPSCGQQWRCVLPKAEEIEEEDAQDVQIQSQPVPRPKRMKLRSGAATNADTLLPTSSQDAPNGPDFRRTTRSSARLRS